MNFMIRENIVEAFKSIRSHALRAALTMVIVAIGIMALVGVLTALESIQGSISSSFMEMGSNTFSMVNRSKLVVNSNRGRRVRYEPINYRQSLEFKKRFDFPGTLSMSAWATGAATVKFEDKKTNPNISVMGIDNNYFKTAGLNLAKGRNFTDYEITSGGSGVIIGSSIKTKLFGTKGKALGKIISIGAMRYRVIGVLETKGNAMGGGGGDRQAYISISNLRQKFYRSSMSFTLSFMTEDQMLLSQAVDEAEGIFRIVRGVKIGELSNFSITRSDNIAKQLIENLSFVKIVASLIAFITLLGASIGLMNIMLVSVSERTREIGLRKALGANNKAIRNQFLVESVVITEFGGLIGIVLGIALGNVVAYFTEGPFVIPWVWMGVALTVSLFVGLMSGLFPAIKASRLDPIESLRFE